MCNNCNLEDAKFLRENIARLGASQRSFATSITDAAFSDRGASEKQWYYIHKLAKDLRITNKFESFPNTAALIRNAVDAGAKRIAVRYHDLVLKWSGEKVYLNHRTRKQERDGVLRSYTYGFIRLADGALTRWKHDDDADSMFAMLRDFENDPEALAAEAGRETGTCCFCGLQLTDEPSVKAGYGPICAKKFGLQHGRVK